MKVVHAMMVTETCEDVQAADLGGPLVSSLSQMQQSTEDPRNEALRSVPFFIWVSPSTCRKASD